MNFLKCWLPVVVGAVTMVGCTAADETASAADNEVVAVLDLDESVTVNADSLTFDKSVVAELEAKGILAKLSAYASASDKSKAEPVFLVGNRRNDAVGIDGLVKEASRNPYGYLRRGVSWTKNGRGDIVVKTIPASLDEAQSELTQRGFVTLANKTKTASVHPLANEEGAAKTWTWDSKFGGPRTFDLLQWKLKDKDGKEFTFADTPLLQFDQAGVQARLQMKSAFLRIEPSFIGEVNVSDLKTHDGFVEISAKATSELVFDAEATGLAQPSRSGTFHIASFVGALGGFPTTMRIDAAWSCELHASARATGTFGAKASGEVKARATFKNFKVTLELEKPTYEIEAIGPRVEGNARVLARCEITPKLAFGVFDAMGPEAALNLWSQIDAQANVANTTGSASAKLTVGGELRFSGGLRPFGFDLLTIDAEPVPLFETALFEQKLDF